MVLSTKCFPALRICNTNSCITCSSSSLAFKCGEVHESASVYVDDTYIGTLISAPYSIEIPGNLLKEDSKLKIRVSNLMANRIADLDKKGIEWRKFYNTNFNARRKENVGKDGKFSAENWEPKRSDFVVL